jgi:hypothetical protein
MGLFMFIIWNYAYRNNLIKPESNGTLRTITHYYFLAAAISITIFILSFVNIWLCLGLSGTMFATFLLPEQMVNNITTIWLRPKKSTI